MATNDAHREIVYLVMIAGRKRKFDYVQALTEAGGRLVNMVYGKGSVDAGVLKDLLGLVAEEQKVLVTCLMARKNAEAALKMLVDKFHFDRPNTGIAFTIPVERLLTQ